MLVNKETLNKVEVIARKMEALGFGEFESLKQELTQKYLNLKVQNEKKRLGME